MPPNDNAEARELYSVVRPFDSAPRSGPSAGPAGRLTLYVEGPRDRAILRAWAYRFMPARARSLLSDSVILGGRQPVRALEHFRSRLAHEPGARALCVLDRDGGGAPVPDVNGHPLAFFTWSRRHIESYLLVPGAIRRTLRLADDDRRVERILEDVLPAEEDEAAWRDLDAKRLLAAQGLLPQALGRALPLARIARATREPELHPDVHELFARVRGLLGDAPG